MEPSLPGLPQEWEKKFTAEGEINKKQAEGLRMELLFHDCPYCYRHCTVGDSDVKTLSAKTWISQDYGSYWGEITIITCPNKSCRKQKISVFIASLYADGATIKEEKYEGQLLPESEAKPFPDYIPEQLKKDYEEACLIKNKSPKASATLSRRCLQGMIRNFWGIKKDKLYKEVEELKDKVDPSTWDAIDSVRQVGNIGAHMERDVNLIIDVEEEEAGLLIWLIETLFLEWYIARHDREVRMTGLKQIADSKKEQRKSSKPD